MPFHKGIGIIFFQPLQQAVQRVTLCGGTGVGGSAVGQQAAFVAHTDGMLVVSCGVCPHLVEGASAVYISVTCDVVVVADGGESAGLMPCDDVIQGGRGVATRGAAMHYYQVDAPVVLVLAAGEYGTAHEMQLVTPMVVANAVNTVMANCNTFCQNSFFIMVGL